MTSFQLAVKHQGYSDKELEKKVGFLTSLEREGILEPEDKELLDELRIVKQTRGMFKHPVLRS